MYWHPQNNTPSALNHQSRTRGAAYKLAIEFREIRAQTIDENGLDVFALIEQHRSGKLHGSVHGEKGVGDDLEARSRFGHHFFRAAGGHPGKFHLRESRNLGHSTESKSERVGVTDEAATRRAIMRIIEKDLIHNQSQTAVTTENIERRGFCGTDEGAGWVVGMDENDGSRPDGGCFVERIEIDLPTVIVEQRIRNEFNVAEIGQKLEQRVARLGYKNLVAGIAEQTKDVRVGFAGACGQDQALGIEIDFV